MLINISTMKGEIPRLEDHLLPDDAAVVARDCDFERGIVAPLKVDATAGVTLPIVPKSLYLYEYQHWFAFQDKVSIIANPMAQDPWQRVYWTGQGKPKVTAQDIAVGNGALPAAWYDLGVPRPATPPTVTNLDESTGQEPPEGELEDYDDETRLYIQTYVTRFGEEGAPSDASSETLIKKPGTTVTISLTRPTENTHNITHTRLYRSVTANGIGDFIMVAELPIATLEYKDSEVEVSGATLETWDYDMPDENMQGMCSMANGIVCGFAGNEVMFSEAYLPYAYPSSYRGTTDDEIVAIVGVETSLVVTTKGRPFVFSGITPSAMTGSRLNVEQSCVSADSLVVVNGVALYASPDGLVAVTGGTASVMTAPLMTREQWQAYKPQTIKAWSVEGKYVAQYDGGSFVFDPVSQSFVHLTTDWDAAYNDLHQDTLFYADGTELKQWKAGLEPRSYVWQSKQFLVPIGTLVSCARIQTPNPSNLSVSFIADGQQVYQLAGGELDSGAFRLPPVRATKWAVKIEGTEKVERILLADSMQELG